MRRSIGDEVTLFNGRDGEWSATISALAKKAGSANVKAQLRGQTAVPDLWLLFSPLKKNQTDFTIAKATELGVAKICPIYTERTATTRVNTARWRANCVEAAEQSERLCVPEVGEAEKLSSTLNAWPEDRRLFLADESGGGKPLAGVLAEEGAGPAAILIGPEGGFTPSELEGLRARPFVRPVALGPRILRAETAAIAAIACWQALCGDWRDKPPPRMD